ncbi:MAG: cyclase family protein [Planctomycetes bacterium]|nr:cyclase family protein [Planctomycetota bacterium]
MLYDVSVTLRKGMPVYPGDVEYKRRLVMSIEAGNPFNLSVLRMGAHNGTHVDAPWHMTPDGITVDQIAPSVLVGPAVVVEIQDAARIPLRELEQIEWDGVERALFKTVNSGKLEELDHFVEDFVYLEPEAAAFLAERGVLLVGVDYLSVDPLHGEGHPAHAPLVENGIVIVEGLDLSAVPPGPYELICAPLKLMGSDGAPARVFLRNL